MMLEAGVAVVVELVVTKMSVMTAEVLEDTVMMVVAAAMGGSMLAEALQMEKVTVVMVALAAPILVGKDPHRLSSVASCRAWRCGHLLRKGS